ncbi:MAG: bacillithiol biosynthesis cysteine-adding enzyme BshC [Ignavibacteriaceae bacterium]
MFINFGDIPGSENLFLDYLYEFENVKDFYKTNFHNKDEYLSKFKNISDQHKEFKTDLPNILSGQYEGLNPSAKTQKNISLLSDKKTLTIVTGQQLGILGGPLYTFYKIITAIKLSNFLSDRYDDFHFVPVFWLEGDDHDIEEVRSISLVNDANEIKKISYNLETEGIEEDENNGSVGNQIFKDTINTFFEELTGNLRNTEFTHPLLERLKTFYATGKSFKQSFKELMFWLFDKYGLILFDPQDIKIKNLLKPIFKKEITDFRQHAEKIVNISAKLEDSFHAQVKVQAVNLFYSNDDGRYLIEPVDNDFRLKRKRKKFTYDELFETIEKEPENFSPNVLLRPICQDYILSTAFYVGGPSEIAYFAQVMPLYEFFKVETPFIYPRSSVTILEKNITSLLEKYVLHIQDVFRNPDELKQKVINSISETTLDDIFLETTNTIETAFDHLKEKLFDFDKTLSDASSKYKQKVSQYLNEFKIKSIEAQKRKHETTLRQIDKIINIIYPNSTLQEREINFIYFMNKYGEVFLDQVFDELAINKFEHQIINM